MVEIKRQDALTLLICIDGVTKISQRRIYKKKIPTTTGQLRHELNWLCVKVQRRDPATYQQLLSVQEIACHPSFEVVEGAIEEREKVMASE